MVVQPCYAGDAAMMGIAIAMARFFQITPDFGYHLEPAKSFCICPQADELVTKLAFTAVNLTVKCYCVDWYVGIFVGSNAMRDIWMEPLVEKLLVEVKALTKVATRYPQSAYHGFIQTLQSEWQYLFPFAPGVGAFLGLPTVVNNWAACL